MPSKSPRSTRSAAELNQEMAAVSSSVKSRPTISKKETDAANERRSAILSTTSNITVDAVVKKVTETQLVVGKTLKELTDTITTRVEELRTIEEAIKARQEELETLHGKDVVTSSLDQLVAEYEAKREELETELAELRSQMDKERDEFERQMKENRADVELLRTRNEAEYNYNLQTERQRDNEEYQARLRQVSRDNAEKQAQLEKNWRERETSLQAREKEFSDLQAQVAKFPELLKSEVNSAVGAATGSLKRELTNQFTLEKKDLETKNALLAQQLDQAQQNLFTAQAQLKDLQNRLSAAEERNRSIAEKALEASSGRAALEAVQQANAQNGQSRK